MLLALLPETVVLAALHLFEEDWALQRHLFQLSSHDKVGSSDGLSNLLVLRSNQTLLPTLSDTLKS